MIPCALGITVDNVSVVCYPLSVCLFFLNKLSKASEQGRPPEHTSKFYAKGALQYLVPILTQTLTKQVCYTHCVCV